MADLDPSAPADPASFGEQRHQGRLVHYDDSWKSYLVAAGDLLRSGLPMAEKVRRFDLACDQLQGRDEGFILPIVASQVGRIDLGKFRGMAPPYHLTVADGAYHATPQATQFDILAAAVDAVMDPEVDCLVEFGSGLGLNLARLALRIGQPARPLTYIACEPSQSGLEVTRHLFSGGPHPLETRTFDYADPQLDFLDRFDRVIALTCHSVEQIPVLGPDFHRALLARRLAAGIHLEPVGWQRFGDIVAQVKAAHDDPGLRARFRREYTYVIDNGHLVGNAGAWATAGCYNIDLLRLVAALSDEGAIAIAALAYDVVGVNPFNPSSLIVWRPA